MPLDHPVLAPHESCHTCESVMSHVWVRHWRMKHATCLMNEACHIYEWVVSYIWMSHVSRVNKSCHTFECSVSHVCMSHVTRMNASCHTYGYGMWQITEPCHTHSWVMSNIWKSPVTRMNVSCHTDGWAMSHLFMNHVTDSESVNRIRLWLIHVKPMIESCHTYEWVMSHWWMAMSKQNCDRIAVMAGIAFFFFHRSCQVWMRFVVTRQCDMTTSLLVTWLTFSPPQKVSIGSQSLLASHCISILHHYLDMPWLFVYQSTFMF